MDCLSCGAALRPDARFCNQCGAVQPAQQQPISVPSLASMAAMTATESSAGSTTPARSVSNAGSPVGMVSAKPGEDDTLAEGDGDSSGRMKRPPRVLRAQDQQDQDGALPDDGSVLGSEPFVLSRELATGAEGGGLGGDTASGEGYKGYEEEEETRPSPAIRLTRPVEPEITVPAAWADAETVETEILPVQVVTTGKLGKLDTVEGVNTADTSIRNELMTLPAGTSSPSTLVPEDESAQSGLLAPDALSWPLPVSIIIGGRYRVETLVSAAPDDPDGENIYRVSDLRGYERCWSCLQEYGEGTEASDRFCRECGADMLAREYLMYERRIPIDGAGVTIDEANTTPEHPAIMGAMATQEERAFTQSSRAYRVVPRITEPSPFPHGGRILIGVATDVGKTRAGERNEDSLGALVLNLAHDSHMQPLALGIVADGLGGHINGQDASRLATRMVTEHILRKVALPLVSLPVDGVATEEGLKNLVLEGVRAANAALCNANDETGADMGSTLVAALLFGNSAYIINVGDSRGYVFFEGELRQITTDHSFVEQLIISGFVAPEDRYTHPQRNQILRSLGDDLDVEIDLFEQKLKPGMRLMLCSDGLWEMVRDDESARILRETSNPQETCDRLIESANEHGGDDNISVVVIEVCD